MVYGVPRGAGSRARLWGGWLSLGGCRVCVWGCLCWNKGGANGVCAWEHVLEGRGHPTHATHCQTPYLGLSQRHWGAQMPPLALKSLRTFADPFCPAVCLSCQQSSLVMPPLCLQLASSGGSGLQQWDPALHRSQENWGKMGKMMSQS